MLYLIVKHVFSSTTTRKTRSFLNRFPEGTAIGVFELVDVLFFGAGKCAFFMAEQFTFNQVFRYCATDDNLLLSSFKIRFSFFIESLQAVGCLIIIGLVHPGRFDLLHCPRIPIGRVEDPPSIHAAAGLIGNGTTDAG